MPDPTDLDDAARQLYAVPPDDFLARRAELSARARSAGDSNAAARIDKLRKPTVAAWIVNAHVLADPSAIDRLTELGERLRAAQDALDANLLRELSAERRRLVGGICADAFARADRTQPPAALRDEVTGTFEAAIADEDVAARLGRLQRAEQWSGFGFLPSGAPELTLVRGGREDARPGVPAKLERPEKPRPSASERRRQERALAAAREAFAVAESAFDEARAAERDLAQEVKRLTKKLAKLQGQLDDARAALEASRKDVTATRGGRREARSALDRAEREAGG